MRILMATDDIQIDRRILQEGKTLVNEGHEVILLARWSEGRPSHEIIDGIKIERLGAPGIITGNQPEMTDEPNEDLGESDDGQADPEIAGSSGGDVISASSTKDERTFWEKLRRWWKLYGLSMFPRMVWLIGLKIHYRIRTLILVAIYRLRTFILIADYKLRTLALTIPYKLRQRGGAIVSKSISFVEAAQDGWRSSNGQMRRVRALSSLYDISLAQRIVYYDPDVIHAHDLPQLIAAVLAKEELRTPLVYDAHELYPEIITLTPAQQSSLSKREKLLVNFCDAIITVNPFLADEMAGRYDIPAPHVIRNCAEAPPGLIPGRRLRRFEETLPISPEDKILLYQGWFSPHRGLQYLVEAMAKAPAHVVLVLMGYGDTKDELWRIVEKEHLEQSVFIHDAVPQAELLFWTASADAGIIPYQPVDLNSRYCSPNKLFEFIQAGLPMIVNDLPYLRSVVKTEGFGVVEKLAGIEDYASAIRTMFDEDLGGPERFKNNLIEKGHSYSWEVEQKRLVDIYHALAWDESSQLPSARMASV